MKWLLSDAGEMSLVDLFSKIGGLGGGAVLGAIVFGFVKKWIVPGWTYQEAQQRTVDMQIDRDIWKDTALRLLSNTTRAVDFIERKTGVAGETSIRSPDAK